MIERRVRLLDKGTQIKSLFYPLAAFKIAEVFDIPLRPANGRKCNIKHCKARILCMIQEIFQHLKVYVRVADDALLPHLFAPRFKLGLDEAGNMPARFEHAVHRGQNELEGNERHIDAGKIQFIRNLLMVQVARICAFHAHHALI